MKKKTCFTPACELFRFFFRWTTSVIALLNNVMDILYAYSTIYVSQTIFFATVVLLLIRVIGAISIAQHYYNKQVVNYKFGMSTSARREVQEDKGDDSVEEEQRVNEKGKSMSMKDAEFINDGKKLYGANYLMFYLGIFRIMPV